MYDELIVAPGIDTVVTDSTDIERSVAVCLSLYKLGPNTAQKKTPLTELYLSAWLLKFLDEPWQTRAKRYLHRALTYRRGDLPPKNVSLILPPAAHDLHAEVKRFVRDMIRIERCNFLRSTYHQINSFSGKASHWPSRYSTTDRSRGLGQDSLLPVALADHCNQEVSPMLSFQDT